jgi:hypothetical protein
MRRTILVVRSHFAFRISHFSIRAFLSLALSLALTSPAFAASPAITPPDQGRPKVLEITPALRDYCGMIYACGLKVPSGTCPMPAELGPPAPHAPNGERCVEARELEARGLRADHPVYGFKLYRFLGHEYRTVYQIPDTLPVSRARLEYLIGDVPLAAKLVSHYMLDRKDTANAYTAEWMDAARTHFKGAKGTRLRGEARLISGSFPEGRLIYIGSGVAEVAFWTLVGPAMMDFNYREVPATGKLPERVAYELKVVVFPGNGVINTIMNLGIFRSVVTGKIRDVLTDISGAAVKLEKDQGRQLLKNPKWSAEERRKIEELLMLE